MNNMQRYEDGSYELEEKLDPVCPFCCARQPFEYYRENVSWEDEETSELSCNHCHKEFKCYTTLVQVFTTFVKSIDGEED